MNLPTSITYNDLRVRLQNINCCLAKKADKLNTLLTLGKSCTDDVIKLEFAYKLLDILKTYNTNLVLIPEIDGIQTEVLYESQAEANCITMAQLDSMLQYLQDYCSICFKEYGTYDSGYIVSNDLGGWVGSNPSLIISTQVQADWDQMDNLQPDFIKNKPEIPELLNLIAGDNITITGTYPNLTISSTGGATVNLPENQIAFGDVNNDLTSSSLFIFKNGKLGINVTDPQYTIDIDGGFQNIGDTILDGTVNLPTLVDGSEHLLGISTTGDVKVMSETDPVYTSSSWYTTTNNSTNWDTAYSWGNHANAGYMLKSTYDTDNDGVVDSAQSMMTIGRNSTGSTLYKGTIVYISGSTGNRPNFVKAKADAESTSAGTFGVVYADIANNSDGYVVTIGTINTLDTRTTATYPFTSDTLADGNTIYLSPDTAGYITNVKPSAPNHIVYLGKVVKTHPTQGTIVYRIQNGYELDELHDVQATSPNSNDILYYDGTTSLWKTASLTSILGYTPVSTSGSYSNPSWITSLDYSKLTGTPTIPTVGTWGALNYPTWSSGTPFVKMTAAGTFALDTNTYLTSVGTGTTNELTYWSGTNTLGSLTTATYPSLTELSYVKGVTSAIQTQIGNKQDTLVNQTNIKSINGNSLLGTGDLVIAGISDGDKGDITVTSSGATWTIDNNVVTNAKAAQMAANTIKANNTGATANASDINMDAFQTMLSNYTTNSTGGVLTNIATTNIKNFRVTAATGLGSFNNGVSGKDIEVFNNTGSSIIIYNEYVTEATATKRIYTGGQNVTLPNLKIAVFTYNTDISRWVLKVAGGDTYFPPFAGTGTRIVSSDANGNTSATYDVINPTLSHQYTALTSVTSTTKTNIWGVDIGSLTIPTGTINRLGSRIWAKHRHDLTTGAVPANITFDLDWASTNLFTSGATSLTTLIGVSITGGFVDTEVYVNTSVTGATGTLTGFVIFKFFSSTGLQISSYSKNFSTGSVNLTADQLLTLSITFSSGAVNTWTSKNGCIILQN